MRQIKGALFKHFIINIRANKSGIYDKILSEEEKKIVDQQILDAIWYPYDQFKMICIATAKAEAEGNKDNLKNWGYTHAKKFLKHLHKDNIKKRGISLALKTYNRLFKLWFNFGKQYGELVSENEINFIFEDFDSNFDLIYYLASGWIQSFIEAYLNQTVRTKFLKKSWEGDEKTIINLSWSS
ncbi:MAG: hypothetical protein ACFFBP_09015 [Promethearchaeota archaeon]